MEDYELGMQLRKAAKLICLNIAEGYGGRVYEKDFAKFLINALGPVNETQVCLDFTFDLGYLNEGEYYYFVQEYDFLGKRISAFISKLKNP